jgi:hypothetical protein
MLLSWLQESSLSVEPSSCDIYIFPRAHRLKAAETRKQIPQLAELDTNWKALMIEIHSWQWFTQL